MWTLACRAPRSSAHRLAGSDGIKNSQAKKRQHVCVSPYPSSRPPPVKRRNSAHSMKGISASCHHFNARKQNTNLCVPPPPPSLPSSSTLPLPHFDLIFTEVHSGVNVTRRRSIVHSQWPLQVAWAIAMHSQCVLFLSIISFWLAHCTASFRSQAF